MWHSIPLRLNSFLLKILCGQTPMLFDGTVILSCSSDQLAIFKDNIPSLRCKFWDKNSFLHQLGTWREGARWVLLQELDWSAPGLGWWSLLPDSLENQLEQLKKSDIVSCLGIVSTSWTHIQKYTPAPAWAQAWQHCFQRGMTNIDNSPCIPLT